LRDAPLLAAALFDLPEGRPEREDLRIGVLSGDLLDDCDASVRQTMQEWEERLRRLATVTTMDVPAFWFGAWDIYAPIQAAEAAAIHAGNFRHFEPTVAARLEWGASLSEQEVRDCRQRHAEYREKLRPVFAEFDFILAPVTPVSRLLAGADHTESRARILRHTTQASLGGLPAVVLPGACGVQLMAEQYDDRRLLRLAAKLGGILAAENQAA
jgi:aspartyl-tRNA(Asn)/glutamyl-tRNA(Gln) amidotransferase subunit A